MTTRLDTARLFKTIDQMDPDEFAEFVTEDGTFVFGNAEPVTGRQAVRDAVAGFYSSIKALQHEIGRRGKATTRWWPKAGSRTPVTTGAPSPSRSSTCSGSGASWFATIASTSTSRRC